MAYYLSHPAASQLTSASSHPLCVAVAEPAGYSPSSLPQEQLDKWLQTSSPSSILAIERILPLDTCKELLCVTEVCFPTSCDWTRVTRATLETTC
jgi:hypothetical protein